MIDHEIVLSDGRFAKVRQLTVGDLVACQHSNVVAMQAALAARMTTLDGKQATEKEVLDGAFEVWLPIFRLIGEQLDRSSKLKDGIA